jgi:hypothetical protein
VTPDWSFNKRTNNLFIWLSVDTGGPVLETIVIKIPSDTQESFSKRSSDFGGAGPGEVLSRADGRLYPAAAMANQLPGPQPGGGCVGCMVSAWVTVLKPISFEPALAVGSTCLNGGRGPRTSVLCQ